MGLNIVRSGASANINEIKGDYKGIGKDTVTAFNKAAQSDGKLESSEIDKIEEAAKSDNNYTDGEKELISKLRESTKDNKTINDLKTSYFDPKSQEVTFNINIADDTAYVTPRVLVKTTDPGDPPLQKILNLTESLSPSAQSVLSKILPLLAEHPADYQKQIQSKINLLLPAHKAALEKTLAGLGIDLTKPAEPGQIESFKKIAAFTASFVKLSPEEQKVAKSVIKLLSENPPQADHRQQIKTALDAFPDKGMKIGEALNKMGLYIPCTNLNAPTTEDASSRLKYMHMSNYGNDTQAEYIRDNICVAAKEGFKVVIQANPGFKKEQLIDDLVKKNGFSLQEAQKMVDKYVEIATTDTSGYVWGEDNKWVTASDSKHQMKIPPVIDEDALNRLNSFAKTPIGRNSGDEGFAVEGYPRANLSDNDPNRRVTTTEQGAVNQSNAAREGKSLGEKRGDVQTTRTYIEGGNMLAGAMPNGEAYAVVGRDSLLISTFNFDNEYKKDPNKVPEFDPSNISKKVDEMEKGGKFSQSLIDQTTRKLENAGYIEQLSSPEDKIKAAKDFLAKLDITQDIMAQDIGIPREKITFVPQPDFHIDMHMRPMGPGQVMINDYDANIELIDKALVKAKPGSWEEKELKTMKENAVEMKKLMGPVMDEIKKQLEESGLKVVKSPGVIESKMENGRTRQVNFMNAIPGTSTGTDEKYYMTNYCSVAPLREAYEEYMQQNFDVDKIYWMGSSEGGKNTKSVSEQSLDDQGGLDCRENHELAFKTAAGGISNIS